MPIIIRRSLIPRPRLVSPITAEFWTENTIAALAITTRLALAERGPSDSSDADSSDADSSDAAAPPTHEDNRSDQHREPGSIGWAKINDRALYDRLVAEQQKLQRHGRHKIMACIATETLRILPALLSSRPHIEADAYCLYDLKATHRLPPEFLGASLQPKYRIRVKVVNQDALDAALSLESDQAYQDDIKWVKERSLALRRQFVSHGDNDSDGETPTTGDALRPRTRKVLLNVTSCIGKMGGRWQQGSLATEEERLCFRTSLSMSLSRISEDGTATKETPQAENKMKPGDAASTADKTEAAVESTTTKPSLTHQEKPWMESLVRYAKTQGWIVTPPLRSGQALYTRDVLVVRNATHAGSTLIDAAKSNAPNSMLPVVSVITVASVHQPPWRRGNWMLPEYARDEDRARIKNKMRLALRIAVANKHDSVVLGTLGCDNNQYLRRPSAMAANPANAVATCWREVLMESEFSGCGWFRDICFAVPEERGDDTYNTFYKVLHNLEV